MSDPIKAAALAISKAKRCVVFSGAGASADSGIATFRGAGGAWSGFTGKLMMIWGATPIGWRITPSYVWQAFVNDFYRPIAEAEPNDGHVALAELQQRSVFQRGEVDFITMNVDGLHQKAGSMSVAEVHGSVHRFRCMSCSRSVEVPLPLPAVPQPKCTFDDCGGLVRPDVTLFLEALPMDQWMRAEAAIRRLQPGDVVLIVGTSSVVYPAAQLPEKAKKRGATLIEFDLELPTPISDLANISVQGPAAETLRKCMDALSMCPRSR